MHEIEINQGVFVPLQDCACLLHPTSDQYLTFREVFGEFLWLTNCAC
jgi:hypothetical protein